ncbi:hypothetical protein F5X99DRAFT_172164 [Biscogniauxia marginata]|nr:hypothetical protein F5X99DRAFT_172164 [Biscogniauxia marginata]
MFLPVSTGSICMILLFGRLSTEQLRLDPERMTALKVVGPVKVRLLHVDDAMIMLSIEESNYETMGLLLRACHYITLGEARVKCLREGFRLQTG